MKTVIVGAKALLLSPLVNGTVRLSFAGDLDLSGNVAAFGEKQGWSTLFSGVSPLWTDSSIVFSNLEGSVLPADAAAYPAAETAERVCPIAPEAV